MSDNEPAGGATGPQPPQSTAAEEYAERLARLSGARWKRVLHVQAPYQAHIRHLALGRTIDVGCGIGRNLASLAPGSVGVDHNRFAIEIARRAGLDAYTVDEFFADPVLTAPGSFDGMLAAHLIEHLPAQTAVELMQQYLPLLRPGARVALITPQERGFASDATHVRFADFDVLRELAREVGLVVEKSYSFPFPRWTGKAFVYNEFAVIARKPA